MKRETKISLKPILSAHEASIGVIDNETKTSVKIDFTEVLDNLPQRSEDGEGFAPNLWSFASYGMAKKAIDSVAGSKDSLEETVESIRAIIARYDAGKWFAERTAPATVELRIARNVAKQVGQDFDTLSKELKAKLLAHPVYLDALAVERRRLAGIVEGETPSLESLFS